MLSRRWLINCALVIVIAVLILIGLGIDDKAIENGEQRISELRPGAIDRIQFAAKDQSMTLQRDAHGWQLRQPIQWPAHSDNVERLLSILNQQSAAVAEAAEVDLAALGLQPPVATLHLNDTRLAFGASNNIGERRYLLLDTSVYLLPDVHLAFATQGLTGMVDRRLLPQQDDISSLRLPGLDIIRTADGSFGVANQPGLTPEMLAQLVANWSVLPATGIRPFNIDANPGELITVGFGDGHEIDFLLQSSDPEIVIANPQIGLQYHFRADYRDQLIAPVGGN